LLNSQGPSADENPFRFSSEYFDDESGLVYYNFRYYSPELGRWMSRDPIGEAGGVNLYGMVGNDVIMKWDGLGLTVYIEKPTKVSDNRYAVGLTSMSGTYDITEIRYTTYSERDCACPAPTCTMYTVFCEGDVIIKGSTWISLLPKLVSINLTEKEARLWTDYFLAVLRHEQGHVEINENFLKRTTTVKGAYNSCFRDLAISGCREQLRTFAIEWLRIEASMLQVAHDVYHWQVGYSISLPPGFQYK
jgi:RHS repeat-associated protein